MVVFDGSEPCGRAEAYYHDFLDDENGPAIPQAIKDHIRQCAHCQRRLDRLRELLCAAQGSPSSLQRQRDRSLLAELQSHYELLGEPVTCRRVKRFLPSLLAPSPKVRIPTPVTVHVDQCPACAQDLESLRALELESGQLARLGCLYADSSANGLWACLRAQAKISVVWPGSLERVDAEILDHLRVCPRCRNRVYQQRKRLLDRRWYDSSERGALGCADILPADVFDLVVPYGGVDPSGENDRSGKCQGHLRSCPDCLEKAQQLHRTVYGIAERPDSGVVTVCAAVAEDQDPAEETEPLYEGYPIAVQVLEREPEPAVAAAYRHRVSARLRPLFKPALIAAAMIPLAAIFLFSSPEALGLSARQVNQIFCETPDVRVSVYGEDLAALKQEFWAARNAGILTVETWSGTNSTAPERVIYELARRRVSIYDRAGGTENVAGLSPAELARAERMMSGLLGLSLERLTWDRELSRLADFVEADVRLEVYELDWQAPGYGGSAQSCQWKVYVDPATRRPVKTEYFAWDAIENDLVREETRRFEYPNEGQGGRHADELRASE